MGGCRREDKAQQGEIWIPSEDHNQARQKSFGHRKPHPRVSPMASCGDRRGSCALILDVYPIHRTDIVTAAAAECDIELVFVPAGGTSEYQPLDSGIFGELMSRAKAEITKLITIRSVVNIDYGQSVNILVRCWNAISGENIRQAWELFSLA
jgi:hypothetical protein